MPARDPAPSPPRWKRFCRSPWAAAAVGAFAVASGCDSDDPLPDPIRLASVYNQTGFQAVLDVPSSRGSALAASEINADGGLLGRELELVAVNGTSVPETLGASVEALLEQDSTVIALVGLSDTDMVLGAAPPAAARGRVFLTSGATSPQLPGQVADYLFLACFGDNVQAAAGAEWAFDALGARDVLVLYDPAQSYTTLLQGYFAVRFSELGGTITQTLQIDPRTEPVTVPPVGDVDLVFLGVETAEDAARVVPLLRGAGYAGPILGGDGYDAAATWADAPDVADVYFTTHVYLGDDSADGQVRAFVEAYEAAYPGEGPTAFAALGYDAVGLIAAAIERSGTATPQGVLDGLGGLTGFDGVTGTIGFSGQDRIPTKSVTILEVTAGAQAFVTEVTPATVPAP